MRFIALLLFSSGLFAGTYNQCYRQYRKLSREARAYDHHKMGVVIELGNRGKEEESEHRASMILAEYKEAHPNRNTKYIRATSFADFEAKLGELAKLRYFIDRLWIVSHGMMFDELKTTAIVFSDETAKMTDFKSVTSIAEALRVLKLAPDVSIHFGACDLARYDKEKALIRFANALGLRSGRVYQNKTSGAHFNYYIEHSPYSFILDGLLKGSLEGLRLSNHGFVLVRTKRGDCTARAMNEETAERMVFE